MVALNSGSSNRFRTTALGLGLRLRSRCQHNGLRIDGDLPQTGCDLRRHILLIAPAQVMREKLLRGGDHGHVVYWPRESVALIWRHQVFHGESPVAQGDHDRKSTRLVYARVVAVL